MRYLVMTLASVLALQQAVSPTLTAQAPAAVPSALQEMADAERAFVRRAQEVSTAQAFIEFFADEAVGFDTGAPGSALDTLRARPSRPRDPNVIFWWEPRTGDISASGDLGWLTGPVRFGRTDRDAGKVQHGNYASIWKRQPDGRFKVVIDIGTEPPGEVPFDEGFTRARFENRYTAAQIAPLAEAALSAADRAMNLAALASVADAFAAWGAPAIRVHRNGQLPLVSRETAVAWLKTQPALAAAESLYAETARAADFGYTWGSYEVGAAAGRDARGGHYTRVWARQADGAWRVVLDLDAPRPPRP